jgi:hypothetical protein
MDDTLQLKLRSGSTMSICGPSRSGKTFLVCEMIKNKHLVFEDSFDTIIFCHGENQPLLDDLRHYDKTIKFTKSLIEADNLVYKRTLMVVDDKILDLVGEQNDLISRLFVEGSHHRDIFVIIILQNLFTKGLRLLSINSSYLIVTKSPRDISSIINLGKQFCPKNSKYLMEAYKRATTKIGGYLLFDFTMQCPDKLRVRNSVFISDDLEIYIQLNGGSQSECTFPQQTYVQ